MSMVEFWLTLANNHKNMKRLIILISFLMCSLTTHVYSETQKLSLLKLAEQITSAKPGDTLLILSGQYSDINLELKATGTKEMPIVIKAAVPGEVIITGKSSLKFAGEWLEFNGFYFKEGSPPAGNSVIEFRLNGEAANNCRITNTVVDSFNPSTRDISYSYLLLYGRHNRVDHNSFLNKLNIGVTLIVMLDQERDQQNFHKIDHNYFGHKPVFGSNGAETIRVGTATQSLKSSNTIIEKNYFERCNGEVEIISIKSSDNIIRENTFFESQGVLALRHGDRNIAEFNYFDGNNVRNTGGIRIVNADHIVRNNFFYRLKGERFFSSLAVMNAVPNSLPNRYCHVVNVDITGNAFIDCDHIQFGVGNDQERTLAPSDIRFSHNLIINRSLSYAFEAKAPTDGFQFSENRVGLAPGAKLPKGFREAKDVNLQNLLKVEHTKREDCGQSWNLPLSAQKVKLQDIILVKPGQDNILVALVKANPGDIIELSDEGDYPISADILIDKQITIRSKEGLSSKPVVRYNGTKKGNIVTIGNGAELVIKGIAFSGMGEPGKSNPASGISTMAGMIKPYLLEVDNCEFFDFPEGSTIPIRGMKNTFSQKVVIKNSLFRAVSADAINFAGERDDAGLYNVEELIIDNCSFNRILGIGINVYRGGSDESTAGPKVDITNCTFEDVCNKERGSVLRLIGAQVLNVANSNFSNSGRGGVSIRLDETTFEKVTVSNCNFWNSGRILTMTNKVVQGKMFNIKPQYINADKFDYRSVSGSQLKLKNIGVR